MTFRRIKPPNNHKPLKPESLYKACVNGDVEMYERCEKKIFEAYSRANNK